MVERGMRDWYQLSAEQTIARAKTNLATGLTTAEANQRLLSAGKNELVETSRRSEFKIFLTQLQSSLVVLLIVAMLISYLVGEVSDAVAILAIVVLNTILGFWQDLRAEKSLAELKKLSVPTAVVLRDDAIKNIPANELVAGDVLMLQAGYFVPADCRLIETSDLMIDESALTGESLPAEKTTEQLGTTGLSIGDQTNVGFMGAMVVRGHAIAVVTKTGMNTQLGQIAGSLQSVEPKPTPLQVHLSQLSRSLAVVAIVVVALVYVVGMIAGHDAKLMLMTALSLAVAAVPEGLPAVATVALAIGARRMFRQNALIRELPAVETLGSVTVICSDKTGTLTQNRMTASVLDTANCRVVIGQDDAWVDSMSMQLLLAAGCLCNDAQLSHQDHRPAEVKASPENKPAAIGEPTEKALVEVAARYGLDQRELSGAFPRTGEVAFSSERKRMTTLHRFDQVSANERAARLAKLLFGLRAGSSQVAFVKGSIDAVLEISKQVWIDDHPEPLDAHWEERIENSLKQMASMGTRVLALGFRVVHDDRSAVELENEMVFVGLVGLTDPPRREAKMAVQRCRRAGIRPIMITGDHPLTALSIAGALGISDGEPAVTGLELKEMTVETLRQRVRDVSVFARVEPSDKLHIVEALQHNNEVVAMTGDGVNDAPALKQANVGVAMGINGTDVSKQAANVVLLDDNFATIVTAVEQGRIVYANVCKFVKYTMSSNVGEILVMTLGVVFGLPLPLIPLQILWINLVTDGLPGLALAVEPVEKHTMSRPPTELDEPIFNRKMTMDVIWIGTLIGGLSLLSGFVLSSSENVDHWRTIIFSALTFAQMGNSLACRSEFPVLFARKVRHNLWLLGAVALTCALQLAVIYLPGLQTVFDTQSLAWWELSGCLAMGLVVFLLIELRKVFFPIREDTRRFRESTVVE